MQPLDSIIMKAITALIMFVVPCIGVHAQHYAIRFAGTGASSTVDSVKVENLSQCTSMTIAGSDTLNLVSTVGIDEVSAPVEGSLSIYPNPSSGSCSVAWDAASAEDVRIGLYNLSGTAILLHPARLNEGRHLFHLDGIRAGSYLLSIENGHDQYMARLISRGARAAFPGIHDAGQERRTGIRTGIRPAYSAPRANGTAQARGTASTTGMSYNPGETIKFTGTSGKYRTVTTLVPAGDQTVTFEFIPCIDADGNAYAVVRIGTQWWMQENLKATHYRDGSGIPNVTDSAVWGSLTSGAYCNFHNDTAEGAQYGRLYNFYAVADARNLCPAGWHVASNTEWNIMERYLDPTVDTTAWMGRGRIIGRILKEGCTTRWAYLDSTWGWNSAGFSALCANFRNNTGAWSLAPNNDHDDAFWTSTPYSSTTAWGLSLRWCFGDIYAIPLINMRCGSSVRCVKDE